MAIQKEWFKLGVYVSLILRRDNQILLIRRFNTGIGDGFYSCAGGKIDGNESITQAMIREAAEEIGIKLRQEDLTVVHVIHTKQISTANECLGFFIEATRWEGEPKNLEPHKHDDIGWFSFDNLPQNTRETLLHTLKMLKNGRVFSEFGWE